MNKFLLFLSPILPVLTHVHLETKKRAARAAVWCLTFLIMFFICLPPSLYAGTKTWSGTTSTSWTTTTNWAGGVLPASGDIVNVPGSLTNYPVVSTTVTITTLNINSSGTGATVTVAAGAAFTVSGLTTVNSNGSFLQTGGTATLGGITSVAVVNISGGTIQSSGTLTLNSGATLTQSGGTDTHGIKHWSQPYRLFRCQHGSYC